MKVKLKKGGRLVPGTSHPYWESNLDDWKELKKKESVDVDVQKFVSLSSDESKESYEVGQKGKLANRIQHGFTKISSNETMDEAIQRSDSGWKFKDEHYFLYANSGLEKVGTSFGEKKLKDKIRKEGGEN